jgi:hypothetical protein
MTISPSLKPHWPKRTTDERSTECDDKELTGEEPSYILDVIDAPAKLALLTCVVDADLDINPIERSSPRIASITSFTHTQCLLPSCTPRIFMSDACTSSLRLGRREINSHRCGNISSRVRSTAMSLGWLLSNSRVQIARGCSDGKCLG